MAHAEGLSNQNMARRRTPGKWRFRAAGRGCTKFFEVGDLLVGHVCTVGGWHFQDEANFSWFARQSPSTGFKGRYSYLGTFKTFSKSCRRAARHDSPGQPPGCHRQARVPLKAERT